MLKDQSENTEIPVIESSTLLSGNGTNTEIPNFQPNNNISNKSRTILWYIIFSGFVINYMIRCNINIAIVAMVAPRNSSKNVQIRVSECFNHSALLFQNDSEKYTTQDKNTYKKGFSIERGIMDLFNIPYSEKGFEWNEYEQGLFLGSYYWLSFVTHIPGGYLANRHGTKLVFGLCNFIAGALSFFIPIAAYLDFNVLIFVRATQGILSGFCWPAMHNIISKWIPPNERSQYVSAYMGGSVGIAIFYPLFGYIISISSWEWIFHFSAALSVIWFFCWQYWVYDSPSKHPRIDPSELNYIIKSLGDSVQEDNKVEIPWKSILTSVPFWITMIAQWGGVWAVFTLIIQLPSYFKFIHGFNFQMSGLISGLPHILRMVFSYVLSIYLDHLLRTNKMTRTNVRKLAVFIDCILSGILTIALAYVGCNYTIAFVLVTLAMTLLGAQSAGPLASMVDLAPRYSSILLGISATVCVLSGTISSYIVGILTLNNQTIRQWNYVFLLSAAISIIAGAIYIIFGSSSEQSWNKLKTIEMQRQTKSKFSNCENRQD